MKHLKQQDSEIYQYIQSELSRQKNGLEMIASENYTSLAVMEAQGSILTNKYAEGYPKKRYYGGCEFIDLCETAAIERLKKLFGAEFANVQPHSGSQANMAVFLAEMNRGDKLMGLDLCHGGHLTHGSPVNFSGLLFQSSFYRLNPKTELLDFNIIEDCVKKEKPKILIAGYSAYPRAIDFKSFKEIANRYGAKLLVDMAHISGLVAGKTHSSPIPYADYVTSTTHKTLRGPRGGFILSSKELGKKINSRIFPGIQGGPLEHVIAGKAVAFQEALKPEFKTYAEQIIKNAQKLAQVFQKEQLRLITGGTDNHLILIDLSPNEVTGKNIELALDEAGITVNKNTIPNETLSPFVTSGIRIGVPAITTRGMTEKEMEQIGFWIAQVIKDHKNTSLLSKIKEDVHNLCNQFPLYENL